MTLYDRLGGSAAFEAAVQGFYRRMLDDERVAPFFEGVDMDAQIEKQRAFLTMACGGPNEYSGLDMRAAHAPLVQRGLSDVHVDVVLEHLGGTLLELGANPEDVQEAAQLVEGLRADVLNR